MTDHPNVAMVRESFDAMGRGDLAWLDEHMSDDIAWHVGGNSSAAGTTHGKDAVRQMMTPPGPDTLKIDLHDIVGGDEHVVVLGTAVATGPSSGKTVEYKTIDELVAILLQLRPDTGGGDTLQQTFRSAARWKRVLERD